MKQLILILIILTAGYVCHAQLRPPVQTDTEKRARWKAFWAPTGAILLFFRGRWHFENAIGHTFAEKSRPVDM